MAWPKGVPRKPRSVPPTEPAPETGVATDVSTLPADVGPNLYRDRAGEPRNVRQGDGKSNMSGLAASILADFNSTNRSA
jgi:hypothetical protein